MLKKLHVSQGISYVIERTIYVHALLVANNLISLIGRKWKIVCFNVQNVEKKKNKINAFPFIPLSKSPYLIVLLKIHD